MLTDVPENARIMNEEPFGPVAVMLRFKDTDEVLARANKLPFGLASYAFTKNAKTATKVADALESGMVTINHFGLALPETPFGGVKDSGFGHEGGIEGLQVYMQAKFLDDRRGHAGGLHRQDARRPLCRRPALDRDLWRRRPPRLSRERAQGLGHWYFRGHVFCTFYDPGYGLNGGCWTAIKASANCYEFYVAGLNDGRPEDEAAPGPLGGWAARAWRKGEPSTCEDKPSV